MHGLNRLYSILKSTVIITALFHVAFGHNITVDDSDPNILYSDRWAVGNECSGCWAQPPDHSQIYQATWHDTTSHPGDPTISFQYQFTGTDLYIYSIQVDTTPLVDTTYGAVSKVDLTLTIDGQSQDYQHPIFNDGTYQYQVPVFSIHNLTNTLHTIKLNLNPYSMFLFDYLVYTVPDVTSTSQPASATNSPGANFTSAPDTHSSLSSGAIAGIAVGIAVVVATIAAFIGFCYGMRRRRTPPAGLAAGSPTNPPMGAISSVITPYSPALYDHSISTPASSQFYPKSESREQRTMSHLSYGVPSPGLPPYSEGGHT